MFFCFETIAIQNGEVQHLSYHQARYQRTVQHYYQMNYQHFDFSTIIQVPTEFQQGLVRCRIDYNQTDFQIQFFPYQRRQFRSFHPVIADQIDYQFKYCHREPLNQLYQQRQGADEILIVQQGQITDCSIGNLVFLRQGEWFTPAQPLLAGTQRQRLLEQEKIHLRTILLTELELFEEIRLINALNPLDNV
ncbi:aminotransferase class IV family protein [Gallibacterium trehalosifermentans]|uniref:Aminotransferase class IV family protein n=1 Tax=Gallibacterium trehalosifermentans TaxID=516935 RepID=A0ABV6H1G1_9PAST